MFNIYRFDTYYSHPDNSDLRFIRMYETPNSPRTKKYPVNSYFSFFLLFYSVPSDMS